MAKKTVPLNFHDLKTLTKCTAITFCIQQIMDHPENMRSILCGGLDAAIDGTVEVFQKLGVPRVDAAVCIADDHNSAWLEYDDKDTPAEISSGLLTLTPAKSTFL
jgi:hypothetical protein